MGRFMFFVKVFLIMKECADTSPSTISHSFLSCFTEVDKHVGHYNHISFFISFTICHLVTL